MTIRTKTARQSYIRVSKAEYKKLKVLQKRFEALWKYFEHLHDIKEARRDIAAGRTMSQEKLFKGLGI